jgi:hypothetical protein
MKVQTKTFQKVTTSITTLHLRKNKKFLTLNTSINSCQTTITITIIITITTTITTETKTLIAIQFLMHRFLQMKVTIAIAITTTVTRIITIVTSSILFEMEELCCMKLFVFVTSYRIELLVFCCLSLINFLLLKASLVVVVVVVVVKMKNENSTVSEYHQFKLSQDSTKSYREFLTSPHKSENKSFCLFSLK